MCHLSSFCQKFGMISCADADRREKDCPFLHKPDSATVGSTTVEIPAARYFFMRQSRAK